jgi:hypothetical protein
MGLVVLRGALPCQAHTKSTREVLFINERIHSRVGSGLRATADLTNRHNPGAVRASWQGARVIRVRARGHRSPGHAGARMRKK